MELSTVALAAAPRRQSKKHRSRNLVHYQPSVQLNLSYGIQPFQYCNKQDLLSHGDVEFNMDSSWCGSSNVYVMQYRAYMIKCETATMTSQESKQFACEGSLNNMVPFSGHCSYQQIEELLKQGNLDQTSSLPDMMDVNTALVEDQQLVDFIVPPHSQNKRFSPVARSRYGSLIVDKDANKIQQLVRTSPSLVAENSQVSHVVLIRRSAQRTRRVVVVSLGDQPSPRRYFGSISQGPMVLRPSTLLPKSKPVIQLKSQILAQESCQELFVYTQGEPSDQSEIVILSDDVINQDGTEIVPSKQSFYSQHSQTITRIAHVTQFIVTVPITSAPLIVTMESVTLSYEIYQVTRCKRANQISASDYRERLLGLSVRMAVRTTGMIVGGHIGQVVIPVPVLGAIVGSAVGGLVANALCFVGCKIVERIKKALKKKTC